jgi:predicted glycogen debranching enzyme
MERGRPVVWLRWILVGPAEPGLPVRLLVRPLLAGAPLHHCHRENPEFRFHADSSPDALGVSVRWRPYADVPGVRARANAAYRHAPDWYRGFRLDAEVERGLESEEDLASPGIFEYDISSEPAVLRLSADAGRDDQGESAAGVDAASLWSIAAERERARLARFPDPLARAADDYLVRRGAGRTIIAGYPWFGDWGRDTFIALRGLCLATGRSGEARDILVEWSGHVSRGMLPNRFPDAGEEPEYNAVDASLWYAVAVGEYLDQAARLQALDPRDRDRLRAAVDAIIDGYAAGTRHAIRVDSDGLVAAGEPGVQLTWMDARCDGWVVTPRIGKPVEVQALWINALAVARTWNPERDSLLRRARAAFLERFWNDTHGCLYDVIDADHRAGECDAAIRPNQILAVGGLPVQVLEGPRAASVVHVVRERLWTPLGLRTLDPAHPAYHPRYAGDQRRRDSAYHQGTVWPWLIGPFVEAHLRVAGNAPEALDQADRLLAPLLAHLDEAGLGHASEIFDAEPPRLPRGCPFQAWSLGELIRARALIARARSR